VLPDVFDEGLAFVLHEKIDGVDMGVHEIAENEIRDSVAPPEGHRGFRSHGGKREEPLSLTACEDHGENLWM
jgi:hypothetical protein